MTTRPRSAQEQAERVLAQIEAAIRIADISGAAQETRDRLRAIHLKLHQGGLRHDMQGSFF